MDAITKYNLCIGLSTDTVEYYFKKCINDSYANWDFYRIEYPNLLTIHYHTWDNTFQPPRYVKKQITIKMEEYKYE